jgi:hypothetical protein
MAAISSRWLLLSGGELALQTVADRGALSDSQT